MFGVVPKVVWERTFPADRQNRVRLATNCLLVRGPGWTALIESGLGGKWDEVQRDRWVIDERRTVFTGLADLGVVPEEIDALVLSHLHFDHAGGATRRDAGRPVPAFPNATLFVQAAELDHARAPHELDRASYRPEDWEPYADAGRIRPLSGEVEIRPGLTAVPVRGHNAGMQAIRIQSHGRTAFYFADALPTTAHLPVAWTMSYDLYPVDLIENKKTLLSRAVAEKWLCIFEHDPRVPWGTVVEDAGGRRRVEPPPAQ